VVAGGRLRSPAVVYERIRLPQSLRRSFAPDRSYLHSRCRSRADNAEGAGAEMPLGTGEINNAVPAWNQAPGLTHGGFSPGSMPHRLIQRPTAAFRASRDRYGPTARRACPSSLCGRETTGFQPGTPSPDPHCRKENTMDEQLYRSVRRPRPDYRCGTVAERPGHARR
jgi:hypothetical protein